jgi:ubiquitin C-terminal hydrolase
MNPVGFVNTGSLCYLNSMLQALLGCKPLNDYLLENEIKYHNIGNKLVNIYIQILKKIKTIPDGVNMSINDNVQLLQEILNIQKSKSQFAEFGFSQEDASECFLLFLDSINDKNIEKFFYHTYKCNIVCLDCNDNQIIQEDTSCQFTINQSNTVNNANSFNLSKYLKFNSSKLESNILKEIPPVIIITLNKYNTKYNSEYPENIEFNSKLPNPLKYKLTSTIEHYGNMFSGHYICKSKRNNEEYLFNDCSFSLNKLDITANTYILVYVLNDN